MPKECARNKCYQILRGVDWNIIQENLQRYWFKFSYSKFNSQEFNSHVTSFEFDFSFFFVKGGSRHKNWCMARVLSFLISFFSNYYTLHRSDLAARAAPLDPRLFVMKFLVQGSNKIITQHHFYHHRLFSVISVHS